jgi:RimJ/RimL family protein N-acetyltransferase
MAIWQTRPTTAIPSGVAMRLPRLKGRGIALTPLERGHLRRLYEMENDPESFHLWSGRRTILSEVEYEESLAERFRDSIHVFLMITGKSKEPIGFTYSYDVSLLDGFAFVASFLSPSARRRGIGATASILFLDYLFSYFDFHKIYCEAYQYNEPSLELLKSAGFELEGEFREHRFLNGGRHALFRYAIYRERFYHRFAGFLERIDQSPV